MKSSARRFSLEDEVLELERIREFARTSGVQFAGARLDLERNPNRSHLVHASLHLMQFVINLGIEFFHLVHYAINHHLREEEKTVTRLPDESDPIFYAYPTGMIVSTVFGVLWYWKKCLPDYPEIDLAGCGLVAILMLSAGILEMVHVDFYIDINEISDDELLHNPLFIHNFVMCILSIFSMAMYLLHFWVLRDYWLWNKERLSSSVRSSTSESMSNSSASTNEDSFERKPRIRKDELSRELKPIPPTFENLPPVVSNENEMCVEKEEPILYCCCLDYHDYLVKRKKQPIHEFQVIHIL